jgi:hypothetical protein
MSTGNKYDFRDLAITNIGCDEARKIMDFFIHMLDRKINFKLSMQKNVMLLADLINREPLPMVNYINGMGRLRRIVLQGNGTKKNPYKFIIPPLSLLTS